MHVELLLAGQPDEVHRVAGDPDRQLRVVLRVGHRVLEHLAVEHVDVHVEAAGADVAVEHADQVVDPVVRVAAEARRA